MLIFTERVFPESETCFHLEMYQSVPGSVGLTVEADTPFLGIALGKVRLDGLIFLFRILRFVAASKEAGKQRHRCNNNFLHNILEVRTWQK